MSVTFNCCCGDFSATSTIYLFLSSLPLSLFGSFSAFFFSFVPFPLILVLWVSFCRMFGWASQYYGCLAVPSGRSKETQYIGLIMYVINLHALLQADQVRVILYGSWSLPYMLQVKVIEHSLANHYCWNHSSIFVMISTDRSSPPCSVICCQIWKIYNVKM
jgi:hypothetical protein